jgi:formyl-CoA transferase
VKEGLINPDSGTGPSPFEGTISAMTTATSRPLEGMLVLDLGQIYNGPYCGLLLSFMGSRVLKIEPPEGDVVRRRKREVEPYPLVMLNSNKESVVLDLKHPHGKALFLRLVRQADVVVENFAAGVMDRLGLGWEVLQAENPRLVYGTGTGFGLTGPYRDLPAMDLTIQAMSGIMNATGFPDRPPVKAGPAVCDFLGGVHLFGGIVSALLHRERTGRGQRVEVAMLEAAVMALASALGVYMDGEDTRMPARTGNRHPALAMAPYNVYPTNDGYVAIFTASDRHWDSITRVLGREDLLSNPEYASTPDRAARMEEIDAMVEAWTRQRGKDDVLSILTKAHVPCAPVRTAREVANDPHLASREAWTDVEHPRRGKTRVPNSPIRLHGSAPSIVHRPAPLLGQDTDRVLAELLGLSTAELAALHAAGVIEPVKS